MQKNNDNDGDVDDDTCTDFCVVNTSSARLLTAKQLQCVIDCSLETRWTSFWTVPVTSYVNYSLWKLHWMEWIFNPKLFRIEIINVEVSEVDAEWRIFSSLISTIRQTIRSNRSFDGYYYSSFGGRRGREKKINWFQVKLILTECVCECLSLHIVSTLVHPTGIGKRSWVRSDQHNK